MKDKVRSGERPAPDKLAVFNQLLNDESFVQLLDPKAPGLLGGYLPEDVLLMFEQERDRERSYFQSLTHRSSDCDSVGEAERLTQRLKRAEQFFAQQSLKAEVSVAINSENKLAFRRKQGAWRLVWRTTQSVTTGDPKTGRVDPLPTVATTETDLVDCSIERKAQAAELLPGLLSAMHDEAKRRHEAARRGNAAMDAFEKLVGMGADKKEGK